MSTIFSTFLYEPLLNTLVWIYHVLPVKDLGIAIIILTLLVKLVLFYPSLKAMRSQKALQEVQPKLAALKEKYGDNKEELGKQIMAFYKENKVNPFSSCLPILIQLPILIALYKVFFGGLTTDAATGILAADQLEHLYEPLRAVYSTVKINHIFLGFVNLAAPKNIILAVLAGVAQFLQARMLSAKRATVKTTGSKDEDFAAAMNKQMLYILPVVTIIFGYQFPAGVTLYWFSSTLFTWIQQLIFLHDRKKMIEAKAEIAEIVEVVEKK